MTDTRKEIDKIHNNYMKAWGCLLNKNTKIVEKNGYSHKDAEKLAIIITAKILEKW